MKYFQLLDKIIIRIVEGIIVAILAYMLLGQLYQVIARNFWGGGIEAVDFTMRYGIVWLGLLGGVVAMRTGNQIRIDLVLKLSSLQVRRWLELATSIATAAICIFLLKASLSMIAAETAAQTKLFGNYTVVPFLWVYPVGFGLIAVETLIRGIQIAITGVIEEPQ